MKRFEKRYSMRRGKSGRKRSKRIKKQNKVKSYKSSRHKTEGDKRKKLNNSKTPDVILQKFVARMRNKFKEVDKTPIQVVRKRRTIGKTFRRNMSPNLERLRREFRGMVHEVDYVMKRDPEKVYVKAFEEYNEYCDKVKIVLKPMSFRDWMKRNYNIEI